MVSDSTTGSQDQKQVKPLKFCEPGVLQFTWLQRVGHDWATEQKQQNKREQDMGSRKWKSIQKRCKRNPQMMVDLWIWAVYDALMTFKIRAGPSL